MAFPLRLKVFKGDELIATRDFERKMIKIGRLSTAHLCLDDEKVSRIHSVLNIEDDGKLSIVDMGSVEGTFLNGKRINKGFVQFGDEIKIGNTRIVVEKGVAAASGAVAPTGDEAHPSPSDPVTQLLKVPPGAIATSDETPSVASLAAIATVIQARAPAPAQVAAAPAAQAERAPATGVEAPGAVSPTAVEDDGVGGVFAEGRHRELAFRDLSFGSYVAQPPEPRRPAPGGGEVGLQIRYYWGDTLLQVSQHASPSQVFVGSTKRCDLRIASDMVGAMEHPLVEAAGGGWAVNLGPGMVGEIDRDGQRTALKQGLFEIRSPDFAWVDMGGVRAELSFAQQPKKVFVPLADRIDYRFSNLFLLLGFVVGAFVISAQTQSEADVLADDLSMSKLQVAKFLIKEAEKPKRNALLDRLAGAQADQAGEMAEKHKGQEGKMGKKDAPENKKNRSAPKAIDINAKELVKNSGLLKAFGSGGGGGLSTIFGQGGLGGDLKGAVGNMFGPTVGDARGMGGLGLKGTGTGGGGMGNTIGIGGIGTKGRGGGLGGYGSGVANLGGKKSTDPMISDSEAQFAGSLDKELIRKVIKANIGQIRYCYENQLMVKQNLSGKVSVRFIIAPNGTVASAKSAEGTSLSDGQVVECVLTRVRGWQFPSPKGGGSVVVTYPFVFAPSS